MKIDQAMHYVTSCVDVQITAYQSAGVGAEEMLRTASQSRADILAYVKALEKTEEEEVSSGNRSRVVRNFSSFWTISFTLLTTLMTFNIVYFSLNIFSQQLVLSLSSTVR